MTASNRSTAVLAYLVLVLLFGGASSAGFAANLMLQLGGAALIGWTLWARQPEGRLKTGMRRFGLALAVLAAVQFLPLPAFLWPHLPGRDAVARGFDLIGLPVPWLTLSLAPWHSLASLTWWLPALAIFIAMREADSPRSRHVVLAVVSVAAVSVALGALQRVAGSGYIYQITNIGMGPGFFANSNHQGSFLLCALALWGGYMRSQASTLRRGNRFNWSDGEQVTQGSIALLLVFGVLVSGSLACLALLMPVAAALLFMARPQWRLPLPAIGLGAVLVVGGLIGFLLYGPVANDLTAKGVVAGISRHDFLITGSRIMADFAPFGSGLGTFKEIYRWYEDPAIVGTIFVNHAHNDLLELLIETGLFGLVALGLFLAWFVPAGMRAWSVRSPGAIAQAASVVVGVELLHSLVDYPLRTAAMSAMLALCCVLLVRPADQVERTGRTKRGRGAEAKHDLIEI